MPHVADWAYAGGLVDGEGSVLLVATGASRRRPRVQIVSTSYELIDYMLSTFSGHFVTSRRGDGDTRKRMYAWRLNGSPALEFLTSVLPFLREERKRQRACMLLFEYPSTDMDGFTRRFHNV